MMDQRMKAMGDALENVKTDPALLAALQKAAPVQPGEAFEQMVSFAYSSMKSDSVTREKVKQILIEQGITR
jgi:hypothetical protein